MKTEFRTLVAAAVLAAGGFAASSEARVAADTTMGKLPVLNQPVVPDAGYDLARRGRGADDGPNHDAKDDRGRRGRDGGKGRGRGTDDGPNHG